MRVSVVVTRRVLLAGRLGSLLLGISPSFAREGGEMEVLEWEFRDRGAIR